jgi:hypothetical protein
VNPDYNANEAVVTNLPLNSLFKFKVAVYDKLTAAWSNFSSSTVDVDLRLSNFLNIFF